MSSLSNSNATTDASPQTAATAPLRQTADGWSLAEWTRRERETKRRALAAHGEAGAWRVINREARGVMRRYSTSFFIVSRFLPAAKRAEVEAVYAAVRYPDEIVDTFPLTPGERLRRLDEWGAFYETTLRAATMEEALRDGVPCFLAAFVKVVRERGIPPEHYRAFLAAMRRDVAPQPFATLEELIDDYIYGSAIVVGYFLAHVYGSDTEADFERALKSARHLGIALQLTNFLRDVAEDRKHGRVYLPQDMLRAAGMTDLDVDDSAQQRAALSRVRRRLAAITDAYYARARADVDAFAPDSRLAINACIKVYGRLDNRIGQSADGILRRESVPLREKFAVLPPSKYWRLPLAFLRR